MRVKTTFRMKTFQILSLPRFSPTLFLKTLVKNAVEELKFVEKIKHKNILSTNILSARANIIKKPSYTNGKKSIRIISSSLFFVEELRVKGAVSSILFFKPLKHFSLSPEKYIIV